MYLDQTDNKRLKQLENEDMTAKEGKTKDKRYGKIKDEILRREMRGARVCIVRLKACKYKVHIPAKRRRERK